MAINQNHLFEELDGVKCGIVEKTVTPERADFLKKILENNGYTVVISKSPPPKVVAKPVAATPTTPEAQATPTEPTPPSPPQPETFTVGVTDITFNPVNAIMGRLLKTPEGRKVTLAYWQQKDAISREAVPYFYKK